MFCAKLTVATPDVVLTAISFAVPTTDVTPPVVTATPLTYNPAALIVPAPFGPPVAPDKTICGSRLTVATPDVVLTSIWFVVPDTVLINPAPLIVAYGLAMLPLTVMPFVPVAFRTSPP